MAAISQKEAAQSILDARALYPDSSLADLYDNLTMPVELRKATMLTMPPLWRPTAFKRV